LKVAALALGSVIVGAAVSFISSELRESWAYLIFNVSQVLIAAVLTAVCVAVLEAALREVEVTFTSTPDNS
jgi:hypothetical protein